MILPGRLSSFWATALTVLSALSIVTEALQHNISSTTSSFALPVGVTDQYHKLNGFNIRRVKSLASYQLLTVKDYLLGTPPSGKFRGTIFLVSVFRTGSHPSSQTIGTWLP
jgi:hypothetical protein